MKHKRKIINTLTAMLMASAIFLTGCSLFSGLDRIIDEANSTGTPSETPSGDPVASVEPTPTALPTPTVIPTAAPTATPSPTPIPKDNPAENMAGLNELKGYIQRYFGMFDGRYGLTFVDIESGNSFDIAAYDQYIAASTSKLPINLYLFKKIAEGELDFDIVMEYLEEDLEYGTGRIIKGNYGDKYTVAQLVEYSLVYSDNCAINMIIRLCGRDNILNYM
ncbi:MAG TPA: serine hydrolase, partial [Clostridia bacterium]|nr:serine hydrolase [Clostridia bacterium]